MELDEALRQLLNLRDYYHDIGKVTEVDSDKRTCTVELRNGNADLTDVRFQAEQSLDTGVVLIPKIGSDVIVAYLDDDEAYIAKTSKLSQVEIITEGDILLNGDDYGGLIKINELKTQIDKNTNLLKQIQNVFKSWVAVPSDGGAALKALSTQFTLLQRANLSDIENKTVKHG
jgi:hypothetical protein